MQQADNREQLWSIVRPWRRADLKTALVPTMGNLHAGHLALVDAARKHADRVIASIYVNPTQFGEGEDFARYPRTLDSDRHKLEESGCDLVFVPGQKTMYPWGLDEAIRLKAAPALASVLEGAFRPGHFDGVVTVVARLFNLVAPDIAVFGEKDYQQLLVIKRLIEDMGYGIEILPVATVREPGGLAMSSRNGYLDPAQKKAAEELNKVLRKTVQGLSRENCDLGATERKAMEELQDLGLKAEYVAIRRADDLGMPAKAGPGLRVLASVWCGGTRLIDNLPTN
jgi:pantoate--beta-alanine ligase